MIIQLLYIVLFLFGLLLMARIIIEFVRSFARDWFPGGLVAIVVEVVFTVTDPPVKLMRRIIPPLNLGGIQLDLSIMVLVLLTFVLLTVVQSQIPMTVR